MGATGSAKEQLHALPGAEFRVARKECDKVPNCKIVLGDRRLSVTFKRLTEAMSTWEKVRFVLDMFKESFAITQARIGIFSKVQEVPITPRKWVLITPITPLFQRAVDLYNTHYPKIFP